MQIKQLGSGRAYYEITADDNQKYIYVPQEFVEKGFVSGKNQFYDPVFMDKKDEVLSKASSFTLPEGLSVNSKASKLYTDPSKGVIWKAEDFAPYSDKGEYYFSYYNISDKFPAIKSLATVNGKTVYATNPAKGYDSTYIDGSSKAGEINFKYNTQGKSGGGLLGGFLGDLANPVLETVGDALIKSGPALQLANFAVPGLGTALAAGTALGQGDIKGAVLNAGIGELTGNSMFTEGGGTPILATTDPNAVGGVTGPDNIDIGGGWSPAAGATAADLEAARLALEPATVTPEYIAPTPTVDTIVNDISSTQPPPEAQVDYSAGNYSGTSAETFLTPDEVKFYGPITDAEMAAAKSVSASNGWTFKQGLDAVRAGLFVNAITGDPLGLGGDAPSAGGGAGTPSGFAQVPIPEGWKSPEYTYTPVQNVTFEDLFPGISLRGTQWNGMQIANPNMTFNEMFASGLQQTPMGTPVDINQIVGSIVGQSTKS